MARTAWKASSPKVPLLLRMDLFPWGHVCLRSCYSATAAHIHLLKICCQATNVISLFCSRYPLKCINATIYIGLYTIKIEIDLGEKGWGLMDWIHSAQEGPVEGSCDHGNEHSGFIKCC
jgi:hypothetical protein